MAISTENLGKKHEAAPVVIDGERARQYAAATNDDNPAYESGKYAPPVFAVVPTWDAMMAAGADFIPPEAAMMIVHGEQDIHLHQPLVPGQTLHTTSEGYAIRVAGSGTRVTIRVESKDDGGAPVVEQYVTLFIRGFTDAESAGPDKPNHDLDEAVKANKVADHSVHVDDDQTFRYRDASGDQMPIHLDDDFAKSVGLPGIIAHGLCTMAMCSQSVVKTVADGDPARLKRLAVRFASNVFPGNDVVTEIYDAGERDGRKVYAFEATSGGATVIKNGLAEVEG